MKKSMILAVLVLLCVLQQGCSLSTSLHVGGEVFYPEGKTAKGGSFGDPATSRHEVMRPYQGSTRNNEGGNKTDKALRAFFKTDRTDK